MQAVFELRMKKTADDYYALPKDKREEYLDKEIDKMVNDAKDHEDEDRKRKEETTTRNNADSLVYSVERSLEEYKDKLSSSDVEKIRAEIESLKKALEGKDVDVIKAKMESLNKASHKISEVLYKQASATATPGGPGAGEGPSHGGAGATGAQAAPAGDDDIVDAEFEVEDDKKRG